MVAALAASLRRRPPPPPTVRIGTAPERARPSICRLPSSKPAARNPHARAATALAARGPAVHPSPLSAVRSARPDTPANANVVGAVREVGREPRPQESPQQWGGWHQSAAVDGAGGPWGRYQHLAAYGGAPSIAQRVVQARGDSNSWRAIPPLVPLRGRCRPPEAARSSSSRVISKVLATSTSLLCWCSNNENVALRRQVELPRRRGWRIDDQRL